MKIVNLGSLNLDHVYQVDRFLLPGETKASKSLTDNAGGKGLNQSIAAVRTGAEVYHAGYFGANSDMLRKVLVDSGVHTEWMEDHLDIPCGHTVIQVDDAGQNCILLFGGTNVCLTEEYIDRVLDQCGPDDILLLQNETNLVPYIIEQAAKRPLGSVETCNKRTINQFIHPSVLKTCQLSMGMTALEPGSNWNTMPSHTHERRMEIYTYFEVPEGQVVFHMCGEPTETRHIVMHNYDAVISPSWSIHSGVGTSNYTFIWAMGGENMEFDDMDNIATTDLR